MKSIKTYLIIVSVLLCIAVGALVYVWYVYQKVQHTQTTPVPLSAPGTSTDGVLEEKSAVPTHAEGTVSEDVTIDTRNLTETQRSVLASFGYKGDTVTIPSEVVACAEKSVGEARFTEVLNGSAPTPFELLKLSPCLKK